MNKLYEYVKGQISMNEKMKKFDSNKDLLSQEQLSLTRKKLLEEKSFLESKMRGNSYLPSNSSTFEEQKSEIYNEIKKNLERDLDNGYNWDTAFKRPDMSRLLDLYERACKTKFETSTITDVEVDTVLSREIPVPYGPPRDLEMLHDFLNNYMSYVDAVNLCESIIRYYHFGTVFAFY